MSEFQRFLVRWVLLIVVLLALMIAINMVADRFDKRRLIIFAQIGTASLVFLLGLLAITGIVEVWHVLVIAFVAGAINAFNTPAQMSLFPHLVDRKVLMSAVALNSSIWQGTRTRASVSSSRDPSPNTEPKSARSWGPR